MAASRSRSRNRTASPPSRRGRSMSATPQRSVSPRSRTPSERAYSRPIRGTRADSRTPIHSPSPSRYSDRSRGRDRERERSRDRSRSYSRSRSLTPPRSSKIIIEKLTKNVREPHLAEIFGSYGPITHIDLPLNRSFGTNRGTAYIIYELVADAEAAIAHMHEAQLDGAVIAVSIVLPRRRFSRSPALARRSPGPFADRDRDRGGYRGGRGGPGRYKSPPGRYRSPPRGTWGGRDDGYGYGRTGRGAAGGGGAGYRGNERRRPYSRSRSPRRSRSPSWDSRRSRTRSRTPPRRRGRYESPPRGGERGGGERGGRRRRSPSYSSYSSHGRSRTRSLSRDRDRSRERYRR